MPSISWEELSDIKHLLGSLRTKLYKANKIIGNHKLDNLCKFMDSVITQINEFIIKHDNDD